MGLPSQFCVCNSYKSCKLAQGKFAFGQGKNRENTGNLKIQFEWVPCLMPSEHFSNLQFNRINHGSHRDWKMKVVREMSGKVDWAKNHGM